MDHDIDWLFAELNRILYRDLGPLCHSPTAVEMLRELTEDKLPALEGQLKNEAKLIREPGHEQGRT